MVQLSLTHFIVSPGIDFVVLGLVYADVHRQYHTPSTVEPWCYDKSPRLWFIEKEIKEI
jgi:hypothetical protein